MRSQISWLLQKPPDQDPHGFYTTCEFAVTNQNRIVLTFFVLVQGQVKINASVLLVLNEMGPGRKSQALYFHTPA